MIAHQEHLIQKGTPSETGAEREYERMLGKRRDETLAVAAGRVALPSPT